MGTDGAAFRRDEMPGLLLGTMVAAIGLLGGCPDGESPDVDTGGDVAVDSTEPADARDDSGGDAAGGTCRLPRTQRVTCDDRIEWAVSQQWTAGPGVAGIERSQSNDAVFGDRAVRVETDSNDYAFLSWKPDRPVDISTDEPAPPVIRVAVKAENSNPAGWQGETPGVILRDADGNSVTLSPAEGNDELLPTDGATWKWLHVPVDVRDGWTTGTPRQPPSAVVDLTAIAEVTFTFDSWDRGFALQLDGLAFTRSDVACDYDCPNDCNGRGRCAPSELRCRCELGAVGRDCGRCGDGFEAGPDGGCQLVDDRTHYQWPNTTSDTTGDAWLRANHQQVEVLRPRVLVLNFANRSSMSEVETLVQQIVRGFELASTPADADASRPPQLQYQVDKIVDMRNGRAGNPEAPDDWPRDNSTLFPRKRDGLGQLDFDYSEMFSRRFADYYGYTSSDRNRPLRLCELVESGRIHDVWIVGAHSENDAVPKEVVEYKQRYTRKGNPVPGAFSACAGNGCFDMEQAPCDRSVRIGFINYERGPGCYLHNIGHLMEWTNSHHVVPGFSRWFDRFAGMDLNERYDVPFESLYGVDCADPPCIEYPDASTARIDHRGETYELDDWDHVCGNTHFPPNGAEHYDYDNETAVSSTCDGFGRRDVSCREDASAQIAQDDWSSLRSDVPDCGGGFLVWWYRRMPAHGTDKTYPGGRPMKSVWPYLFY